MRAYQNNNNNENNESEVNRLLAVHFCAPVNYMDHFIDFSNEEIFRKKKRSIVILNRNIVHKIKIVHTVLEARHNKNNTAKWATASHESPQQQLIAWASKAVLLKEHFEIVILN